MITSPCLVAGFLREPLTPLPDLRSSPLSRGARYRDLVRATETVRCILAAEANCSGACRSALSSSEYGNALKM
jgi:hypothetical protein